MGTLSPAGKVPILVDDGLVVWGGLAWIADALREQDFLDFEEPYRPHR